MAVGDAHVFPGFLIQLLTQLSFLCHRLLISHASVEVRGENTPERKFAPTRYPEPCKTPKQDLPKFYLNSSPNNKTLDLTKLRADTDDKLKVAQIMKFFFEKTNNYIGIGESAGCHNFLLLILFF